MRMLFQVLLALAAAAPALSANAESLRCSGGSVDEGESRVSVLYKCGQPSIQDSFCAPVYYGNPLQPVPDPVARAYVPCLQTDEWLYDRGPGNLVATVRFRSGAVVSIKFQRAPG